MNFEDEIKGLEHKLLYLKADRDDCLNGLTLQWYPTLREFIETYNLNNYGKEYKVSSILNLPTETDSCSRLSKEKYLYISWTSILGIGKAGMKLLLDIEGFLSVDHSLGEHNLNEIVLMFRLSDEQYQEYLQASDKYTRTRIEE